VQAAIMLSRWLELATNERALLIRAVLWLALVELGLRTIGFRRLAAAAPVLAEANLGPDAFNRAHEYARWIGAASRRHPLRSQCLHQSLVLHYWLRREGLRSELRIGVQKQKGELKAHAWVELDGHVIEDGSASLKQFTPLAMPSGERPTWKRQRTQYFVTGGAQALMDQG
jgi:Transglutaminase-like superfamily